MANNAAYYHWWKNYWTARSAGGWTPAQLASDARTLLSEWNVQKGVTIDTGVSELADQIGSNDFTQPTTSAQPTLSGTGTDTVLTFDGIGDYLSQPVTADNFQNLTRFEWWGVVYVDGANTIRPIHFMDEGAPISDGCLAFVTSGGVARVQTYVAGVANSMQLDVGVSTGYHVFGFRWTGSAFEIYVNDLKPAQSINAGSDIGTFIGGLAAKANIDKAVVAVLADNSPTYAPNKEKLSLCFGGTTDAALSTAAERTNIFNYINQTAGLGL